MRAKLVTVRQSLRVAFFTDSFHELNGVGTVSREFLAYAQREEIPICCVRAGRETRIEQCQSVTTIELKRGVTFALDTDLHCDPFLSRYRQLVMAQLRIFRPDLIHITGPGDMGTLGFWVSNSLNVPMVASWHTNLHEYASSRVHKLLGKALNGLAHRASSNVEHLSLAALTAFYRLAHFVMAPNQNTVDLLRERTGRPAFLMKHGVDTGRFSPARKKTDGQFRIGWVGRLTPEKNVRSLVEVERQLLEMGARDFHILVIGDGSEREWLRQNLKFASLPGFLQGEELANAFASMDVFVFPSQTDTFGLVILEAMASGVPVVLSPQAGNRIGIRHGLEGFLTNNLAEGVLQLMRSADLRHSISSGAIGFVQQHSWSAAFDQLYESYGCGLGNVEVRRRMKPHSNGLHASS